jgi:hypothetical protein
MHFEIVDKKGRQYQYDQMVAANRPRQFEKTILMFN